MNILIVDDHELFRKGLRALLPELGDALNFAEAGSIDEATRERPGFSPNLVLLDYHLTDCEGFEGIVCLRQLYPASQIVVLSGEEAPRIVRDCIDAGASGYIFKSSSPDVLINGIKLVLGGGVCLPREALAALDIDRGDALPAHGRYSQHGDTLDALALSARQRETLRLAIKGMANKVIARELGISVGTVKSHLYEAYKLLGVKNRTEALLTVAQMEAAVPYPAHFKVH